MYLELMNRDRNSREFDQGATLIAAGLARDENRDRIMQTYSKDPSGGSDASMFQTLGLLQKQQQELAIKNQLRLAVPRIAKEYGLSLEDAYMLFENGQLEEYIKTRNTPSYTTVTDPDTGQVSVVDQNKVRNQPATTAPIRPDIAPAAPAPPVFADDGTPVPTPRPDPNAPVTPPVTPPTPDQTVDAAQPGVTPVTGKKKRETEWAEDSEGKGGKVLIYKNSGGERVDGKGFVTSVKAPPRATKSVTMEDGSTREVYTDDDTFVDTGEKYTGTGVSIKIEYKPGATSGSQIALDANGNRVPEKDIPGTDELTIEKDANGQFQVWNKTKGEVVGTPKGAKTDTSTDDMKEWAQFAAAQKGRGEAPMDFDKWYDKYKRIASPHATSGNVDPATGTDWGNPNPDMSYVRDGNGNFVMDPDTHTPKQVVMSGTKRADEAKTAAEAEKTAADHLVEVRANVTSAAERALGAIEAGQGTWTDPVSGLAGAAAGLINPEGSRSILVGAISTIKSNMAFKELRDMRKESKTGGALGNVSNEELALLSSTVTNLDIGNLDVLKENLKYVQDIINNVPGAGKKYLAKIHEQRVAAAKARGEPAPPDPPGLDNGGTRDDNAEDPNAAPAEATAPKKGDTVQEWDPVTKTFKITTVQ
jgi:hypothetical protein